jgi:uncharacterized protein (TIGR02271 family)
LGCDRVFGTLISPLWLVSSPAENVVSDEVERHIDLVAEQARVEKRVVERNVVRIRTAIKESEQVLSDTVSHEEVGIRRVPINQEVDVAPSVREQGDVIVIPIVEERAVLVKRLVLVEELHVQRRLVEETVQIPVTLRATEVFVESPSSPTREDT